MMARKSFDPFGDGIATEPDQVELDQAEPELPPPTLASPLGIGLHDGIDERIYHSDPCATPSISPSLATIICNRSVWHGKQAHPKFGAQPSRDTKATDIGTIVHAMVLGTNAHVWEIQADNYRGKAAQVERDQARARGMIPLLSPEIEPLTRLAERIKAEFRIPDRHEVSAVWQADTDEGPCLCRCRIDALLLDLEAPHAEIVDLKITADASPDFVQRNHFALGRHIQAVANVQAIETLFPQLAGRVTFRDLYVEIDTVQANIVGLGGADRELGMLDWSRAQLLWTRALKTNHWPAYELPDGRVRFVDVPTWRMERAHDARHEAGMKGLFV
jgi:hypothetical protein